MDLTRNLYDIFRRVFKVDALPDEDQLIEGSLENWDSLGHLNLFLELEKEFKLKFSLDDIEKNRSFKDILILLEDKLGK